jgi:hypothetical protein
MESDIDMITAKKGSLYIIGNLHRLGVLKFAIYLEHRFYTGDLYDLYNIFYIEYHGVPHYIIEIPSAQTDYEKAHELANECDLKLKSGKPYAGGDDFKLACSGESCFTLESIRLDEYGESDYRELLLKERATVQQYLRSL